MKLRIMNLRTMHLGLGLGYRISAIGFGAIGFGAID